MDNQNHSPLDANSILSELGYKPSSVSTPANSVPQAQPAKPAVSAQPVRPAAPAQPARPAMPTQPTRPAVSAQPVRPAVPAQPTRPAMPTQPTRPAVPMQPVRPAAPVQPTRPAMPTQPTRPAIPTQPVKPTVPAQPAAPVAPAQPARPTMPTQPTRPAVPTQPVRPAAPVQPTRPAMPTQPTRPAVPTQPVRPATPVQPATPVVPTQPARPTMPAQPTRPAAPTQPVRPAVPVQPTRPAMPTQPARPAVPTQPTTPVAPAQPARPTMPAQPVKPAIPTQPVRPATPTQPARPAVSTQAAQPIKPVTPAQPAKPVTSVAPAQTVKPATAVPPVKPAMPAQPVRPVTPPQPTKPAVPTQPAPFAAPVQGVKPTVPGQTAVPVQPTKPVAPAQSTKASATAQPVAQSFTPVAIADETNDVINKTSKKLKGKKKKGFRRFVDNFIITRGDKPLVVVRKCVSCLCVLLFLGCACYLLNDFVIIPLTNTSVTSETRALINEDAETDAEKNFDNYPSGILKKYRKAYFANNDLVGWIKYPSTARYWPGIDYPVVQAEDNEKYLYRDFNGKDNKNGTIFLDYRCKKSTDTREGHFINILYGHNMKSGQMFASLNRLLSSVDYARSAPVIEYNTIFEESKYKVFAVVSFDASEGGALRILNDYIETDDEFLSYVAELRLRSWYNYSSVDVNATDELLILFTCSNTYQTTMGKSGRTVVIARKVRKGESPDVDTASITVNEDKLMPKVWYRNKKKEYPAYYTGGANAALNNEINNGG